MKKKILLIALAVILLLGCGIGAWNWFAKTDTFASGQWRWTSARPNAGAMSEYGYYYLSNPHNILTYVDFASGNSAVLCPLVACSHDSPDCDASIGNLSACLFIENEHLYYINELGVLCRRDATGLSLVEIGTPGKQFIGEQSAVTMSSYIPAGRWLYYQARVTSTVEEYQTGKASILEMVYIGRIHLTTGKDEILIEERDGNTLRLCAVQDGSVLINRHMTGGLDRDAEDYLEQLRQATVTLERWDEDSGKTTVLFQKKRQDCLEMQMIVGNKLYYLTTGVDGSRGDNYTYDLKTGKEELIAENASYWHLGGGYAFRAVGDGMRELVDLATGKTLYNGIYDITKSAASVVARSEQGVVLQYVVDHEDGTGEILQGYVTFSALTDGLQKEDLIPLNSRETNISGNTTTTPPTNPAGSDDEWKYKPISFKQSPPLPEEYIQKSIQYLPGNVENPEGLPVLKWVFIMENMDRLWTEEAVIELNGMLADKYMPFRVQFAVLMSGYSGSVITGGPYADYDLLGSAEAQEELKDADLIFGYMTPNEMQELLAPITDYVKGDAQPTLRNSVAHKRNWLTTTVEGEIYGIAQHNVLYGYNGWYVDKSLMEKAGLTPADFQHDFWEMDEVFAKLYQANGNKPFMPHICQGTAISFSNISNMGKVLATPLPTNIDDVVNRLYQTIGVCFAIENNAEAPTVVNLAEKIRFLQEAMIRYADAGYCGEDVYSVHYGSMGILQMEDGPIEENGIIYIPIARDRFDSLFGKDWFGTNGIAAVSQHKEEAVQLLHLLAEDEAFRNQFLYGKEGRDYTVADGEIIPVRVADGTYYSMADACKGYTRFSNKEELQKYRDSLDTAPAVNYPIAFDYTAFEEELNEIGRILGKYYWIFYNNEPVYDKKGEKIIIPEMTPELYDEMLQELKDAGSDEIMAELQQQLDEWLAANPNWDK